MFKQDTGSTHVVYIVDHSASMGPIWDEMVNALDRNLEEVKKAEGTNYVSLIMFDDVIEEVMWRIPASKVSIDKEAFKPRGFTAMLDAVGKGLTQTLEEGVLGPDEAYYFVIISDGYENASREFNWNAVAELVNKANNTGHYTITYLGSNQDLSKVSKQTNINVSNTMNWHNDRRGTQVMAAASAGATSNYFAARATGQTVVDSLYGNFDENGNEKGSTVDKS